MECVKRIRMVSVQDGLTAARARRKPALALVASFGCCWLCAGQSIPPWFPKMPPLPPPRGEVIRVATVEELLSAIFIWVRSRRVVVERNLIVDPASGNLALTSSATGVVGRGVPLAGVSDDIRGRARAENPDLGAWESEKPGQASPAPR